MSEDGARQRLGDALRQADEEKTALRIELIECEAKGYARGLEQAKLVAMAHVGAINPNLAVVIGKAIDDLKPA